MSRRFVLLSDRLPSSNFNVSVLLKLAPIMEGLVTWNDLLLGVMDDEPLVELLGLVVKCGVELNLRINTDKYSDSMQ